MPLGFIFWILMLFWIASSFVWGGTMPVGPSGNRYPVIGFSFFLFCLFVCIGWKVFGGAVR